MLGSVLLELDDKCLVSRTPWRFGAQVDGQVSRQRGNSLAVPINPKVAHAPSRCPTSQACKTDSPYSQPLVATM